MSIKKLRSALSQAMDRGDWRPLREWTTAYSGFGFNFKPAKRSTAFNERIFTILIKLLDTDAFLNSRGAYLALVLFEYDWNRLTKEQKIRLLSALEEAYPKFKSWVAQFVIAELLGQYFKNWAACEVLCRLKLSKKRIARSLVPVGFHDLIMHTRNGKLAQRVFDELLSMQYDVSKLVRVEVYNSVEQIRLSHWDLREDN